MSRAATLPGAAARSPQSIEMDPHFTKLQPWRPRAGGTAPGERQGMQNLFKPRFKLNADATAPGSIGPRPAERLACARRRTGGRASARKTLANRQLELQSLVSIEGSHYWTASRFQTLRVCLAGLHWFPLRSKALEAAGAQPIGSTKTPSTRETPRHCAAAARELPAR